MLMQNKKGNDFASHRYKKEKADKDAVAARYDAFGLGRGFGT